MHGAGSCKTQDLEQQCAAELEHYLSRRDASIDGQVPQGPMWRSSCHHDKSLCSQLHHCTAAVQYLLCPSGFMCVELMSNLLILPLILLYKCNTLLHYNCIAALDHYITVRSIRMHTQIEADDPLLVRSSDALVSCFRA